MESICIRVYNGSMLRYYNFRTTWGLQYFGGVNWHPMLIPLLILGLRPLQPNGWFQNPVPDAPEVVVPGMHGPHYKHG